MIYGPEESESETAATMIQASWTIRSVVIARYIDLIIMI